MLSFFGIIFKLNHCLTVHTKMRKKGRGLRTAVGPEELLKVVEDIYKGKGKFFMSIMYFNPYSPFYFFV